MISDQKSESSHYSSGNFFKLHQKKIDFAIFSAMPEELEFFHLTLSSCKYESVKLQGFNFQIYEYNNKRILLTHTGLGTTFAASVMTLIYSHFSPSYIFLSGTAGGIKQGLELRDVIIAEKAFEAEIQGVFSVLKDTPFETCLTHPLNKLHFPKMYPADEGLLEIARKIDFSNIKVHTGTVVSSNTFPAPLELFKKIKCETPYSIDMETSAFYQVAWLLKARVLAVRGISNILNHDGTDDKVHESDIKGSAKVAANVIMKIVDKLILKLDMAESKRMIVQSIAEKEVAQLIKRFNLQPHPEGGYYVRTFQSADTVKPLDQLRYNNESRNAGTSIYYLLKGYDFSAWHILKSDEVWNYHKGSSVKIHVIDKKGTLITYLLGDPLIHPGASFQVAITAGNWFAAEVSDKTFYCLIGCTVTPGFEFKDFHLADRNLLSDKFPEHSFIIAQFTRPPKTHLDSTQVTYPVSSRL